MEMSDLMSDNDDVQFHIGEMSDLKRVTKMRENPGSQSVRPVVRPLCGASAPGLKHFRLPRPQFQVSSRIHSLV